MWNGASISSIPCMQDEDGEHIGHPPSGVVGIAGVSVGQRGMQKVNREHDQ